MRKLIPRLDYRYSLQDVFISLKGVFTNKVDTEYLSSLFKTEDIFFVNHARTGIRIALNSVNLKENAKIGVLVYNCKTVFNSVKVAGYKSVFIDVTNNFQIDLEDLKRKKDEIDAIVITHLYGIPADMEEVRKILPANIPIIEDCAHSLLSRYKKKLTGTYGDIAVYSFGKGKLPSVGDGGFVVVNNKDFLTNIKKGHDKLPGQNVIAELKYVFMSLILAFLHNPVVYGFFTYPFIKKIDEKSDLGGKYEHKESRTLKVNIVLFLKKMNKLNDLIAIKKRNSLQNAEIIKTHFKKHIVPICKNSDWNYFMLPLISDNRDEVMVIYQKKGFEIGKHFSKSIQWATDFGYKNKTCPNAEILVEKVLTIPTYKSFIK